MGGMLISDLAWYKHVEDKSNVLKSYNINEQDYNIILEEAKAVLRQTGKSHKRTFHEQIAKKDRNHGSLLWYENGHDMVEQLCLTRMREAHDDKSGLLELLPGENSIWMDIKQIASKTNHMARNLEDANMMTQLQSFIKQDTRASRLTENDYYAYVRDYKEPVQDDSFDRYRFEHALQLSFLSS
jgi:hypothetical protein